MSVTVAILQARQRMPLEAKILMSQQRIREWYEHYNGEVYASFSGGKDSTVLIDLIKNTNGVCNVPSVFVDTGLEYPEVRMFARNNADVILTPEMSFKKVIEKYGYPVIGKKQSRFIRDLQNPTDKNENVRNLHLTGYTRDGRYCPSYKLAEKWKYLIDAPFKISEQCCDVMKKKPFKKYEKETGRKPYIGTMTWESDFREKRYLEYGCNAFEMNKPQSTPLAFWTEQDILRYLKNTGIEYASVYGDIVETENGLILTGEQRTGCMFCMFGCHLEKEPNRFQRMKEPYPKQYEYCMNKLGLDEVLTYMDIAH